MRNARSLHLVLLLFSLAVALPSAVAQVVSATLPAGTSPDAVAVNSVTNKIYVANSFCGIFRSCPNPGTVTVIDGATNTTAAINVGYDPYAVAVNEATNQIYVVNQCGNDPRCNSLGTVTVIDGNTNNTATVNVGADPAAVAVNVATNQIYVANECGNDPNCKSPGTVTVIDGATNNTVTVNVGNGPEDVEVNPVTNKIYVVNGSGNGPCCMSPGTVTVIDGARNNVINTVTVGFSPSRRHAAVNPATNQIYVPNSCGNDVNCQSPGTVTDIDGISSNTVTVSVGYSPEDVEVNWATNQIYAVNSCGGDHSCSAGTVTVIDGASNSVVNTVTVGVGPDHAAINPVTNELYVPNLCGNDSSCSSAGTVTVINGFTNNTVPVAVGDWSYAVAVNASTDRIYVTNSTDGTVSVIAGDTALQFVPVPPCRLVDTRPQNGGGGPIQGGTFKTFYLPQLAPGQGCADLSTAAAYSLNVTLVPYQGKPVGYLTIWPVGEKQPVASTTNSLDGRVKANAAIVPAGVFGGVSVFVSNTADVVLDIDGYFTLAGNSTLAFYPLPPCRVADTRYPDNQGLGAPYLTGQQERDFPILNSNCIPQGVNPQAYSFNFTAVPHGPLGYLTVWPTDLNQPVVSTLNAGTGTVVANAAIVPAGIFGYISAFASNDTDLVIDINGYFAAPGQGGLSLYPMTPCRVLDTRLTGQFLGTDVVDVV